MVQVLTNVKESRLLHTEQPQLFLSVHIAQNRLAQGQPAETKTAVVEAKETLASLNDVSIALGESRLLQKQVDVKMRRKLKSNYRLAQADILQARTKSALLLTGWPQPVV